MSRTPKRKSEAKRPSYITPGGYRKLEEEAHRLWTVERPALTKAIATAAAEGDRSENAEYIYGKKKLRELDRRLKYLGERLDNLTLVDGTPENPDKVYFGARVLLEDEEGNQARYELVGADETDAEQHRISVESPMARALIGKEVGDEVSVPRPRGLITFSVEEIHYG